MLDGRVFTVGPCVVCRTSFTFDPELVPVVVMVGDRHPICQSCVELANPIRRENGVPPITVPDGAYG